VRVKGLRDGSLLAITADNNLWVRREGVAANGTWIQVPKSCCIVDVEELPDGRLLGITPQNTAVTSSLTIYNTMTDVWRPVPGTAAGTAAAPITISAIASYSGSEWLLVWGRLGRTQVLLAADPGAVVLLTTIWVGPSSRRLHVAVRAQHEPHHPLYRHHQRQHLLHVPGRHQLHVAVARRVRGPDRQPHRQPQHQHPQLRPDQLSAVQRHPLVLLGFAGAAAAPSNV
jgi:hypothetical protein